MSLHEAAAGRRRGVARTLRLLVLAVSTSFAAPSAWAYVVVTSDNQVYEVPSRPEIQGDMVFFTLDGVPVSLRVYDVNIRKTNEYNFLLDSGQSVFDVAREARTLPPARPDDNRVIASHPLQLKRVTDSDPATPDYRIARPDDVGPRLSFGDSPGPRTAPPIEQPWPASPQVSFGDAPGRPSAFEDEASRDRFAEAARQAYDDASREAPSRSSELREPYYEREPEPSQPRAMAEPERMTQRDSGRIQQLQTELDAEQARLRRLTSGEEYVSDLDRAIDRSLERIQRLQRELADLGIDAPEPRNAPGFDEPPPPRHYQPSGRWPAGSREARMERRLSELRERLAFYEAQQADLPPGSSEDREIVDERIGEIQYNIDRLERRLAKAAGR